MNQAKLGHRCWIGRDRMDRRVFCRLAAGFAAAAVTNPLVAAEAESAPPEISALAPRDRRGHHFVIYADCCSGTPNTPFARNLQSVNAMVARIQPRPEFILFPGDAVMGYTKDYAALRGQWDYWLDTEMAWVRREKIPLYQSTSNHNTYDAASEQVFREVHPSLPQNGPPGQEGLAYWIRRGDLLYISTHQPDQRHLIDHAWLDRVLSENADAKYKFVAGHYPVFPVNGYLAYPLWCFPPCERRPFWDLLVKHGVDAYLASHIIAFDVQVHDGVPQILSGGAGTAYGPGGFMPGASEYFHAVQMAVDAQGLRYQVHGVDGRVREQLSWPLALPPVDRWQPLSDEDAGEKLGAIRWPDEIVAFRVSGTLQRVERDAADQTILCGIDSIEGVEPVWIGIDGDSGRLNVRAVPESGRGWQRWKGPRLAEDGAFDFQVALHPGMGPGGILLRKTDRDTWSSFESTSSRGVENLKRPSSWAIGHAQSGPTDRPFHDASLRVAFARLPIPNARQ